CTFPSFHLVVSPSRPHRDPHSFPTRRSSDLRAGGEGCHAPEVISCRLSRTTSRSSRSLTTAPSVSRALPACRSVSPRKSSVRARSEEHTSELQSPDHLVCRLLLEKKKHN